MTNLTTSLAKYTLAAAFVATLTFAPTAVLAQSLENNPSLDGNAASTGLTTQAQTSAPLNPLWFIAPIVILAIVALWFLRPSTRQTSQRHASPTYSMAGVKGGETSSSQPQYRTDNDVYADSLNDQETRLRRIFDEPITDDDPLR